MGIKHLTSLVSKHSPSAITSITLHDIKNYTIAIDGNIYIYKFLYGGSNHINGLYHMVQKLRKNNIKPLFIFDGKSPVEKNTTLKYRRKRKTRATDKIAELQEKLKSETLPLDKQKITKEIMSLQKRLVYITDDVIQKATTLLDYMGVGYIIAPGEAEHYCSKLSMAGLVDAVLTDDTDAIPCGSKIILRNFSNKISTLDCYTLVDIQSGFQLDQYSIVDLCILLGTDYNKKLLRISTQSIFDLIVKYRTLENIIEHTSYRISINYEKIRAIFALTGLDININTISKQLNKEPMLNKLTTFLTSNSDININDPLVYPNICNNIYSRYEVFDSAYQIPNAHSKKNSRSIN